MANRGGKSYIFPLLKHSIIVITRKLFFKIPKYQTLTHSIVNGSRSTMTLRVHLLAPFIKKSSSYRDFTKGLKSHSIAMLPFTHSSIHMLRSILTNLESRHRRRSYTRNGDDEDEKNSDIIEIS